MQQDIRHASFALIHGENEYKKVSKLSWFSKNIVVSSFKRKPKKMAQNMKKKSKKVPRPASTHQKAPLKKIQLKKEGPKRLVQKEMATTKELIIGLNIVIDNNSSYYKEDLKQSLGIETGLKMDNLSLTYEYRFFNLVKGEEKVVENRFHLFNIRKKAIGLNIERTSIDIYYRIGLGSLSHKQRDFIDESGMLYNIGGELSINKIFHTGLLYEYAPEIKEYQGVIALYLGAGLNL